MPGINLVALVYQALASIWGATISIVPNIIAAIIIVLVGFVIGKLVGTALEEILMRTKVDDYVKVKKAEFKVSHIFTVVVKWVVYLVFIQQAASALQVTVVSSFVGEIVGFIPNVLTAMVVVAAGYAIGKYVEELVSDSDFVYANLMSRVFFFMVVYIAIALALPKVGLDAQLVNSILLILVASIGLGFAIALGLGLKDYVGQMAVRQMSKIRKKY